MDILTRITEQQLQDTEIMGLRSALTEARRVLREVFEAWQRDELCVASLRAVCPHCADLAAEIAAVLAQGVK